MTDPTDRHERGVEALNRLNQSNAERIINTWKDVAPDLSDFIIKFAYGDVNSRPGLDLKSRQIATVAALTARGDSRPQLRVHISNALNVGVTKEEVVEVILQMAVYAGFPAAINAMEVAKEVFEERMTD